MKIKFGSLISDGRGHIGGVVFSRGQYGPYVKSKVSPTNPQTPAQIINRGIFLAGINGWSKLSPTLRLQWEQFASEQTQNNEFGDPVKISAQAWYVRITWARWKDDGVPPEGPPLDVTCPSLENVAATYSEATNKITATFTSYPNTEGCILIMSSTPPLSNAKTNFKSDLRVLNATDEDQSSPYEYVPTPEQLTIISGKLYGFALQLVRPVNGIRSVKSFVKVTAGA